MNLLSVLLKTLLADGSDEKDAVDALCELVSGNFGE